MATLSGNITESLAITDWRVTAYKVSDGTLAGTTTTSGSSYSITVGTTEPHIVVIHPKIDYKWAASTVIALNEYRIPTNLTTYPYLLKCTARTSDFKTSGSEPTWPSSGTQVDGNVTWTVVDNLIDPQSRIIIPT